MGISPFPSIDEGWPEPAPLSDAQAVALLERARELGEAAAVVMEKAATDVVNACDHDTLDGYMAEDGELEMKCVECGAKLRPPKPVT